MFTGAYRLTWVEPLPTLQPHGNAPQHESELMREPIFLEGYHPADGDHVAQVRDYQGQSMTLTRADCELRIRNGQSRGADVSVTRTILENWPG